MPVEHKESFVAEAVNSFPGSVAAPVVVVAGGDDDGGRCYSFEADVGLALKLDRERQGMMVVAIMDVEVG